MKRSGFSLIQISILLVVAGILLVTVLPGGKIGDDASKRAITLERMKAIEEASKAFMAKNLRRPCPADAQFPQSTSTFGTEIIAPGTCISGGLASSNFGPVNNVVAGGVPTKTLGLPDEYALDGYGRRMMYLVDVRATAVAATAPSSSVTSCFDMQSQGLKGNIAIYDSYANATAATPVAKDNVMWALVSYGKDGHGAFPAQGGSTRIDLSDGDVTLTSDTSNDTDYNAFVDNTFALLAPFPAGLIQKEPVVSDTLNQTFDTQVWYAPDTKNTCCIGKACSTPGFRMMLPVATNTTFTTPLVNFAVGDINRDGIQDLAIGNAAVHDSTAGSTTRKVYVLFGSKTGWPLSGAFDRATNLEANPGVGGFTITDDDPSYASTLFGRHLAMGDLNGDGYDDLVIGGRNLTIIFGPGGTTGTANLYDPLDFSALSSVRGLRVDYTGGAANAQPGNVAIGDVDGDGYKDIVFTQSTSNHTIWVIRGAAGNWADAAHGATGAAGALWKWSIGALDSTYIYRIVGGAATYPVTGHYGLSLADVDGDGKDDIIAGNVGTAVGSSGTVLVLLSGSFNALIPAPGSGLRSYTLAAGTFNGTTGVILTAAGYFKLGAAVAAADMNNDGYADIVVSSYYTNSPYTGAIFIYNGRSAANWTATAGSVTAPNITINTTTNRPTWTTSDGAGAGSNPLAPVLKTADVNGDGKQDLLIGVRDSQAPAACGYTTDYSTPNGAVYILFQPTAGWASANLFQAASAGCNSTEINTTAFPNAFRIDGQGDYTYSFTPAVLDFNKDGKPDIIIGSPNNDVDGQGTVVFLYGRKTIPWDSTISTRALDPLLYP